MSDSETNSSYADERKINRLRESLTKLRDENEMLTSELEASQERVIELDTRLDRERASTTSRVAGLRWPNDRLEGLISDARLALKEYENDATRMRLWVVRRTDVVGKAGEYGKAVVRAPSSEDAVHIVLTLGFNGGPLYGYRDAGHTICEPLTCVEDDPEGIVVIETLR